MSLWWKLYDLKQSVKKRANSVRCFRCGLYFEMLNESCPYCTGIKDADLEILLKERASHNASIGSCMILAAIVILALLVFIALK